MNKKWILVLLAAVVVSSAMLYGYAEDEPNDYGAIPEDQLESYYQQVEEYKKIEEAIQVMRDSSATQGINNSNYDEFEGIPYEDVLKIKALREKAAKYTGGEFCRAEAELFKKISPDLQHLTIKSITDIISTNNSFEGIFAEIDSIYPYPDFMYGSGFTFLHYIIDDYSETGYYAVYIVYEQELIKLVQTNADGTEVIKTVSVLYSKH